MWFYSRKPGFSYKKRVFPRAQPPRAQESWVYVGRDSTDTTVALVNTTVAPVNIAMASSVNITAAPKNTAVVTMNITVVPRNIPVMTTNITVVS